MAAAAESGAEKATSILSQVKGLLDELKTANALSKAAQEQLIRDIVDVDRRRNSIMKAYSVPQIPKAIASFEPIELGKQVESFLKQFESANRSLATVEDAYESLLSKLESGQVACRNEHSKVLTLKSVFDTLHVLMPSDELSPFSDGANHSKSVPRSSGSKQARTTIPSKPRSVSHSANRSRRVSESSESSSVPSSIRQDETQMVKERLRKKPRPSYEDTASIMSDISREEEAIEIVANQNRTKAERRQKRKAMWRSALQSFGRENQAALSEILRSISRYAPEERLKFSNDSAKLGHVIPEDIRQKFDIPGAVRLRHGKETLFAVVIGGVSLSSTVLPVPPGSTLFKDPREASQFLRMFRNLWQPYEVKLLSQLHTS